MNEEVKAKDWRSNKRVSKNSIPNTPTKCTFDKCPHCVKHSCANPRENKLKADATCHTIGNKRFVEIFNLS